MMNLSYLKRSEYVAACYNRLHVGTTIFRVIEIWDIHINDHDRVTNRYMVMMGLFLGLQCHMNSNKIPSQYVKLNMMC